MNFLPRFAHPHSPFARSWIGIVGVAVVLLLLLLQGTQVCADETHQPVFYEGRIGPYQARVVVRPPGVIPGLVDISVRILSGEVQRVSALPLKWNSGKKGAPPADVAAPVRGEDRLYATQLWFMETGAHGIEVILEGAAGEGRVLVPVNSAATRVTTLPKSLGVVLACLGVLLVALLVSIAGAAVRESVLAPGETPSRRRLWAARGAVVGMAVLVGGLLWGGWSWWEAEAKEYRNNRLYRPRTTQLSVASDSGGNRLQLAMEERNSARMMPLVPDHGRLMHVFLVREPELDVLAHVHPIRRELKTFEAMLPPVPGGEYAVYAQVTFETGFAETLTNRVKIPAPPVEGTGVGLDPDDGWHVAGKKGEAESAESDLGDGFRMVRFESERGMRVGTAESLRFGVVDRFGRASRLQPYLGMLGHMVVRSRDGRVFTHVHPSGSFSMAAQQLLEMREKGEAPRQVAYGATDPLCRLPGVEESTAAWMGQLGEVREGEVSFPYEFVRVGAYRVWVQVRVDGKIRTGVFDVEAAPMR